MLLRTLLLLECLFYAAHSVPVTKIEDHSNDLREAATENTSQRLADSANSNELNEEYPKIYDDFANLEVVPAKISTLSKRTVTLEGSNSPETTRNGDFRRDLISYVSKNIANELPEVNLTDTDDVERMVGTVLKLYGRFFESKAASAENQARIGQEDSAELMFNDQPMNDESGFKKIVVPTFDEISNVNYPISSSERPSSAANRNDALTKEMRQIPNEGNADNRTKDIYRNAFKQRVLNNINRPNSPVPLFPNLTIPFPAQTIFDGTDSPYTEKIRSFYPTCEIPKNTKEAWKEENLLNLFFDVDYGQNATIATATLRLHRLPRENQTTSYWSSDICPENNIFEEEKLLRVSIYWYVKPAKKHSKVKRRLCDSKMIGENSPWVELSVKAATKTWTKSGKNMGLAVALEDQDGGMLKASKYFKGATCTLPQDLYQLSLLTQQNKPTTQQEYSRFLESTRRDPFLVTFVCYPR